LCIKHMIELKLTHNVQNKTATKCVEIMQIGFKRCEDDSLVLGPLCGYTAMQIVFSACVAIRSTNPFVKCNFLPVIA